MESKRSWFRGSILLGSLLVAAIVYWMLSGSMGKEAIYYAGFAYIVIFTIGVVTDWLMFRSKSKNSADQE